MFVRLMLLSFILLAGAGTTLAQSETVLVLPFENLSGDRNLDWIGEGIAELIVERLQAEPGLHVFTRDERLAAYELGGLHEGALLSRASALRLAWDNGADEIILGSFSGSHQDFRIEARILDLRLTKTYEAIEAGGKLEDVIPLTNTLSWQVLKKLVPATTSPESDYTTRPPIPRSAFENYVRGILSSDPEKEIELLENAIRLHPQYSRAVFELGRVKHLDLEYEESNMWLEKLGQTSPDPVQTQFMIALNYFNLGSYARAAELLARLPRTYDTVVDLGAAFFESGDHARAVSEWKNAAGLNPAGTEAHFNLAYTYLTDGNAAEALRSLTALLKLQPRDAEALYLYSQAEERLGRFAESQKALAEATTLLPRIERWRGQPLPKLQRLRSVPILRAINWTAPRIARRDRQ